MIAMISPALVLIPNWRELILGLIAGIILCLLGIERARSRRRMTRLAAQLKAVSSLEKLEVLDDPTAARLDQALNEAIQRVREQARMLQLAPQQVSSSEALRLLDTVDGVPRNVAVLALGLGDQEQTVASHAKLEQLRQLASMIVGVAERRSALLQMQGNGTFALIFAAFSQESAAQSTRAAFAAALELITAHPTLRFGLSAGMGLSCTLPGAGYTVIGAPLEEAIRLYRLAASWHEYWLLCPEPVALLLRPGVKGQRTHLKLTLAHAPPLPVYALELAPGAIALGA